MEHARAVAPERIGCAVLTVSDTRAATDDVSGGLLRELLSKGGYPVRCSAIVADEAPAIRAALTDTLGRPDVVAVIVTGGTGIAERDVTIESLGPLWHKELPGFGELFRALSYAEIGARAFLSRATAGIVAGKFVAVLPGSPAACRLGAERLILPQLGHVAALLGAAP